MILAIMVCYYLEGSLPTAGNAPECYGVYDTVNDYDKTACDMRFDEILDKMSKDIPPPVTVQHTCFENNTDTDHMYGHLKEMFWPKKNDG